LLAMKNYFIRMFNYDSHANRQIIELVLQHPEKAEAVKLMAHLLSAQNIWLNRCKGFPIPAGALWPDWPATDLPGMIDENGQAWVNYLATLQPGDFEKIISYKNTKGIPFNHRLSDILTHVINHGTHHRAQAGQHLKTAGVTLPITDYIFYVREQEYTFTSYTSL